jgi:hypothetical protein
MSFKIWHVSNNMGIVGEIQAIVIIWVTFCFLQYYLFIAEDAFSCCGDTNPDQCGSTFMTFLSTNGKHAGQLSYYSLLIRDLTALLVTFYFLFRNTRREKLRILQLQDRSNEETLFDFKLVLNSVLPHSAFKRWLKQNAPVKAPLLEIVELYFKITEMENNWIAERKDIIETTSHIDRASEVFVSADESLDT